MFIIIILVFIIGFLSGALFVWKSSKKFILEWKSLSDKHLSLYELSIGWIQIKQKGKKISKYLLNIGCKNIGIYGMSYLGEQLFYELNNSNLKIIYGIDKNIKNINIQGLTLISPDDIDNRIDTIIITPITNYEDICKNLSKWLDNNIKILSLDELIYNS